jgi:hypothetical protein
MRGWPSPPVGNAENSAADIVNLTSFPFLLVLRSWVWKAGGLIWAPVVTRLQWLQIIIMPSGKDQQGVTNSGL